MSCKRRHRALFHFSTRCHCRSAKVWERVFRLEDGIKPWKELQRQVSIEVTHSMEKAQTSEIKNGPYFHWAVKKRERLHIFVVQESKEVSWCLCEKVTFGTLLVKENEAPVWNKLGWVWRWDGEGRETLAVALEPWKPCPSWLRVSEGSSGLGHFLSYQTKFKPRV